MGILTKQQQLPNEEILKLLGNGETSARVASVKGTHPKA